MSAADAQKAQSPLGRFSRTQAERFQRHFSLAGFGIEAQARLRDSRILVVGAGGLGAPLLTYLAAAGVGRIDLVDHDVVERSNLHRQVIHGESSLGEPKTASAAQRMRDLNPEMEIHQIREAVTAANALELVGPVDLVIDGSDNFETRYVVSDACEITGRPLISGSILRFYGQVGLFWSAPDPQRHGFEEWVDEEGAPRRGPTYRDVYPEAPDAGEVPTCAQAGVLGVLPGVIGSLMATEAVKFLAQIGRPLLGRMLTYDALESTVRELRVEPDPDRAPVTRIGADVEGLGGFDPSAGAPGAEPTPAAPVEPAAEPEAVAEPEPAAGDLDFNPFTGEPKQADDLSPAELRAALAEGRVAGVVDVREPWEHAADTIQGAVNIPLMQLWQGEQEPPGLEEATEDSPLVVYCAHGVRSRQALQILRSRRPEAPVRNLLGGFELWKQA